ncbi:hypothetical protein D6856_10840 [Butyrivibrio sp. XB500-5]|uniref:mersacidin family lantibiotic n=1 Tax=Butyrivibrio sp. XB500-5 TaxID=2364880 RepID=UPI000EA88620|nr:hypothetical protein [Butyrivibrio sp. XB500-5]RKM59701.1 hypothetical protein D6856_10840 [Butyrivibrio sp. XB500-5]
MAKEEMNKAVGNSFEGLKDEEMKKTQGAGDTEAEYFGDIYERLTFIGTLPTTGISLPPRDSELFR